MLFACTVATAAPASVAVIDTSSSAGAGLLPGVVLAEGPAGADPRSHGSLMSVAIAAPWGSAPGAPVVHYNCATPQELIDGACALRSITDAAERGVGVISLSWSFPMASVPEAYRAEFAAVVARARAQGTLVFAAAYSGGPTFPADLPGVVSVGAAEANGSPIDPADNAAIRVATQNAPGRDASGVEIVRLGSSFATAEVAGQAARIISEEPGAGLDRVLARIDRTLGRSAPGAAGPVAAAHSGSQSRPGRATAPGPSVASLRRQLQKSITTRRAGRVLIIRGTLPRGGVLRISHAGTTRTLRRLPARIRVASPAHRVIPASVSVAGVRIAIAIRVPALRR